jgi:hypothetical protein
MPTSPVGYQVVVVADESVPGAAWARRLRAQEARTGPPRKTHPLALAGMVAAGVFSVVAFVSALVTVLSSAAQAEPRTENLRNPGLVVECNNPPNLVALRQVVLPEGLTPGKAKVPVQPNLADRDAGQAAKGDGKLEGRETFGTAVEFARNPVEASRAAAEERKLAFFLHVSGNFEDAKFT